MTEIKLIATDIDGTILKYNQEFNQSVIDCIKELDRVGLKIILITGRMNTSAQKIADILNLKTPVVSYQGALVKDCDKVLYERYINNDCAKDILKWAKTNGIHSNLYLDDQLYVEEINETTTKYTGQQNIPYVKKSFNELTIDKVNKILIIDYDNEENVSEWQQYLTKMYPELYIVKSTPYFCEVCHKEATKGAALTFLQELYGITKEETLAIGDHDNDVELLLSGGIKVAMGNGTDGLKSIADYITDTVDNDGFIKAIKKFVKVGTNV